MNYTLIKPNVMSVGICLFGVSRRATAREGALGQQAQIATANKHMPRE